MADPIESRADPARQRLFRSVFQPSSLEEVTAAVAVAVSEGECHIYVERSRDKYRWSLCCRGGPYPLLRIAARFLKVDCRLAFVGFYTIPDGWCVLVEDPAARVEPDAWTVLSGPDLTRSRDLAASIKAALDANPNSWPTPRLQPERPEPPLSRVFGLTKKERMVVMEAVLGELLREGENHDWIVFENAAAKDEYVQIMLHDGHLYGEVSSREWEEPVRPLDEVAISMLAHLGFTGGGPRRNFSRDSLSAHPASTAQLVNRLFASAYGPTAPSGIRITSNRSALTAITDDLILG
jgi:hypothetical protein